MASGSARIGFEARGGVTRLARLYQSDPLRVLFPHAGAGEPVTGALVTTSGGLVGGDALSVAVDCGAGTSARIVGQAAEKVYRSTGADTRIGVDLTVGAGGWMEWLPQETIVFETARLRRDTVVEVAPQGRLMAGEIVVFGRTAMGEAVTAGLVRDAWEVRRAGRLVWADSLHLDGGLDAALGAKAGFDGARAYGSMVYVGADAGERLAAARELAGEGDEGLRTYATCLGEVLVVRWLGRETRRLRAAYGAFWAGFRNGVAGLPAAMPRLWAI